MKASNGKSLSDYIELTRQLEPVMTMDEVRTILQNSGSGPGKTKFSSFLKRFIMFSTLGLLITLGWWMIPYQPIEPDSPSFPLPTPPEITFSLPIELPEQEQEFQEEPILEDIRRYLEPKLDVPVLETSGEKANLALDPQRVRSTIWRGGEHPSASFLRIPRPCLIRLGVFVLPQGTFVLTGKRKKKGRMVLYFNKDCSEVRKGNFFMGNDRGVFPVFVTDKRGKEVLAVTVGPDEKKLLADELGVKIDANNLIPVLVEPSAEGGPQKDLVLWYVPNEAFLESISEINTHCQDILDWEAAKQERKKRKQENKPKENESEPSATDQAQERINVDSLKEQSLVSGAWPLEVNLFPNPADQQLQVKFALPDRSRTKVSLADLQGRELQVLWPAYVYDQGEHQREVSVEQLPPGIYFVNFESATGQRKTRKLVIK